MDGYFPSELQMRYPDGIPLQVSSAKPYSSIFWKRLLSWLSRKLFRFLSPICWMLTKEIKFEVSEHSIHAA